MAERQKKQEAEEEVVDEVYEQYRTMDDPMRRVLGNLSEPRSKIDLMRVLAIDPHAKIEGNPEEAFARLSQQLERLKSQGLVVELIDGNTLDKPEALIEAVTQNDQVPDLDPEKAEALVELLSGKRASRLQQGGLWYMTKLGKRALGGAQYVEEEA